MSPRASRLGFPTALPAASLTLPTRFLVVPSTSSWVPDFTSNDGSFFIGPEHTLGPARAQWGLCPLLARRRPELPEQLLGLLVAQARGFLQPIDGLLHALRHARARVVA